MNYVELLAAYDKLEAEHCMVLESVVLDAETIHRLEAELAKAHEYGYQYRQERNRAEADLAALKEIPEQAEIAGYKSSDGSLMSAESGAMFTAKHMDSYEPLITLAHHNAIVSSLKAKAAVPEGLLDRIDSAITAFTSGRASMHVPPEANDVDMVLAECWKMVKSMLAAAPAQPQNREEPTNDA